jgi:hypothetical protein
MVTRLFELPTRPTREEVIHVRSICEAVSTRAASYAAVSIYSLVQLRQAEYTGARDANAESRESPSATLEHETVPEDTVVACLGSVIEKYPGFFRRCQEYLDTLQDYAKSLQGGGSGHCQTFLPSRSSASTGRIELTFAYDSSLTGAAIAAFQRPNRAEEKSSAGARSSSSNLHSEEASTLVSRGPELDAPVPDDADHLSRGDDHPKEARVMSYRRDSDQEFREAKKLDPGKSEVVSIGTRFLLLFRRCFSFSVHGER